MIAALRRAFRSLALTKRGMATADSASEAERLFACLFPGQQWAPQHMGRLAGRLRELSDSLAAQADAQEAAEKPPTKKRRKDAPPRELDFGAYRQRYVALELLYLGHAYQGFARQADTEETIEGHLFAALRRVRLIPPEASWQEMQYSRGGRTDKGVSALGQVIALQLRSAARAGGELPAADAELDYPALLNRVLPADIRILGWADVPQGFSARFSAQHREYRYLIAYTPKQAAQQAQQAQQQQEEEEAQQEEEEEAGDALDVERMREAAAYLVGEHDFRNFCKVDVSQVQNFRRSILEFRLEELPACAWGGRRLLQLHIKGSAFLWHQVRCMMAVLLMVGRGEEAPSLVRTLLDVAATPRKPQYNMASDEPLLLYSCAYGGLSFRRSQPNYALVRTQLEGALHSHLVRAGMLHTIQQKLASDGAADGGGVGGSGFGKRRRGTTPGVPGTGARHIPMRLRAVEPAVEERVLKLGEKRGTVAAAAAAAAGNGAAAGTAAAPSSSSAAAAPVNNAVPAGGIAAAAAAKKAGAAAAAAAAAEAQAP